MTAWERALIELALQAALVSTATLALLGRSSRLSGSSERGRLTLATWGLCGLAILTSLSIVRAGWSGFAPGAGVVVRSAAHAMDNVVTSELSTDDTKLTLHQAGSSAGSLSASWSQIKSKAAGAWSKFGGPTAEAAWPRVRWWILAPIAALMALAACRLGVALVTLARLHYRSQPIDDAELRSVMSQIQTDWGIDRQVALRETPHVLQAAVIGWLRPVILISPTWSLWSDAERRLVLAHELAHIRQRDFVWRFASQVILALHAYQPMVHWLCRRLTLEQELAADRAAAGVCGGSIAYLRTLSGLALRNDGRCERFTLAPVFTGLLMRRIEMLRTKEGQEKPARSLPRRLAPWGLLVATIAALAIRLPVGFDATVSAQADEPKGAAPAPFSRDKGLPELLPVGSEGLVELRFAELLDTRLFQALPEKARNDFIQSLLLILSDTYGDGFGDDFNKLAGILVDRVYVDISTKFAKVPDAPVGQSRQVIFGSRGIVVTLLAAQNWLPILEAYKKAGKDAGGEQVDFKRGEVSYIRFSNHLPKGPNPNPLSLLRPCVAFPDNKTIVFVFDEKELDNILAVKPREETPVSDEARRLVAGGLMTYVYNNNRSMIEELAGITEGAPPPQLRTIAAKTQTVAMGIDITGDNLFSVRFCAACPNTADAADVKMAFDELIVLARDTLAQMAVKKVVDGKEVAVDGGIALYRSLLDNCQSRVEQQPHGAGYVVIESSFPVTPAMLFEQQ